MHFIKRHDTFIISLILLVVVVSGLFPFCQYYVDPDGTSYLAIAERYAAGDYTKAINGYWSPLSCWFTAVVIKLGNLNAIPASIIVNTTGAAGFLFVSYCLFLRFQVERILCFCLLIAFSLFLSLAVYYQTFDDLWQCFLLLASVAILVSNNFRTKPFYWVIYGLTGSVAYLAKAYSFPFFIVNTVICLVIKTRVWKGENKSHFKNSLAIALLAFVFGCIPWMMMLTTKYQRLTTGDAGTLNLSWYVAGHPYYKEGIRLLLPPPYTDARYYWEDPSLVNGAAPHFWSSWYMLRMQVSRFGYNVLKCIRSMNDISSFFLFTYIMAAIALLKPIRYTLPGSFKILAFSFLLFPLGFLPINYEPRYIWFTIPFAMITGALFLKTYVPIWRNKYARVLLSVVFGVSFLVYPIYNIGDLLKGRTDYMNAMKMQKRGIVGSFAAGGDVADVNPRAARLAWFSGSQYYVAGKAQYTYPELLADIRRYQVRYFVYFCSGPVSSQFRLYDEAGKPFPELKLEQYNGMKIFEITPL